MLLRSLQSKPMSQALFKKIAIIGLGQMGASLAKAFRAYAVAEEITGYDSDERQADLLVQQGTIARVYHSPNEAAEDADLVVLCVPVSVYHIVMEAVAPIASREAIFTDIGSIKEAAVDIVKPHLLGNQVFVPAHPIAGSEKSGAVHASAELFAQKLFFVTLADLQPSAQEEKIVKLWQRIQADAQFLPTGLHDQIYALMSHMPQLLAYVSAQVLLPRHMPPVDPSLRTHLRISKSDPHMWRDVFYYNRKHMVELIEFYMHILGHIRNELLAGANNAEKADIAMNAGAVLPYMLASCLISTVSLYEQKLELPLHPFAAGGFRDFTHAAALDPEPILQAISAHAADVAAWLDETEVLLEAAKQALASEDKNMLMVQLASMQQSGEMLLQNPQ